MSGFLSFSALLLAAGAAWMDLQRAKVDNAWLFLWLMISLLVRLHDTGPPVLYMFTAGMLLPVLLLFPFFYFRMLGAGDIKTLAVLGSMMGPESVLICIFLSFLTGAAFSLFEFLVYGGFYERLSYFLSYVKTCYQTGHRIPYLQSGVRAESLHMTIPIFLAVLLWAGGLY